MIRTRLIWLVSFVASLAAAPALADQVVKGKAARTPSAIEVLALLGPCDWTMNTDSKRTVPFSFFDQATRIVLYVESDGRHVAAIDSTGKVVWVRDPFVEAHFCPYRVSKPMIVSIEQSSSNADEVIVRYDSSQFGTLRKDSGEFTPLGQN